MLSAKSVFHLKGYTPVVAKKGVLFMAYTVCRFREGPSGQKCFFFVYQTLAGV